jgi:hypothetical protein
MKQVIKIDDPGTAALGAPGGGALTGVNNIAKPNYFSFKKGEGSSNLDETAQSPEVAQAIAKFQAGNDETKRVEEAQAAAAKMPTEPSVPKNGAGPATDTDTASRHGEPAPKAEGFPNGLHDN